MYISTIATETKIQVSFNLNQVPEFWQLPDKRVVFYVTDCENGQCLTVAIEPKLLKKLTQLRFADREAVIIGELGEKTETGFELISLNVQIFENTILSENS